MTKRKWSARTRQDLIVEVWESLDCESVGSRELQQIHQALLEQFGEGAAVSPAAIARTVADEGAVLRHPEVFECDRSWREENLKKWAFREGLDFTNLASALASVVKLEERRLQLQLDSGAPGLKELREVVVSVRKDVLLNARSKIFDETQRQQLKEIAHWLAVWLPAPQLFSDWLDLRRRSPEFKKKFGEE